MSHASTGGLLELEGRFDQPHVFAEGQSLEAHLLLTIRPGDRLRALEAGVRAGTNVCLLFDVSQSMEEEGRLEAAIAAGRELVSLTDDDGLLSIIAFDDDATVLAEGMAAGDKPRLFEALEGLRTVGGGMTNITAGLNAAISTVQAVQRDDRARVIILLSDGEDNTCKPDVIAAAVDAADADIQLFAVGMGDHYEADFLKALVAPSNGTLFGHADVQKVKEAFIDLAVTLSNVVATQAMLTLRFGHSVMIGKTYKASPDQLFLGPACLGQERQQTRRVGNIERSKEYAFLYALRLPSGAPMGELPVVEATLSFDVPALGVRQASLVERFSVVMTRDRVLAERRDGAVLECARRVGITELVERFVEAHHGGLAEDTARYLDLLIRSYSDVNDQRMVNHYQNIRAELLRGGQISRTMINASVVASTVVRGGGELPVIIDDDF